MNSAIYKRFLIAIHTKALQRLLPSFAGCPKVFGKCFTLALDGEGHVLSVVEAEPAETRQAA